MARINPFQQYQQEYDSWFAEFPQVLNAELRAVRRQLPESGRRLEVGVGSGIFASALNIDQGLDPAQEMLAAAKGRGIMVTRGIAEELPYPANSFECVLMVTVLCFVDDPLKVFKEIRRVLTENGKLVVAFIDRQSPLGSSYCRQQHESTFYREARFLSTEQVSAHLQEAGFKTPSFCQTIFKGLGEVREDEPVLNGCGAGGFVVAAAICGDV